MSGIWKEHPEENLSLKRNLSLRILHHIAATIAGEKPATIMNIVNNGERFRDFWDEYGKLLFSGEHLKYLELKRSDRSVIVLFYSACRLNELLGKKKIKEFLESLGYEPDSPLENILDSLKKRFNSDCFPHEVGIFLGIPLKDVRGFMGSERMNCSKIKRWRIYGKPDESLRVIERYKQAEDRINRRILLGEDPLRIINENSDWVS